MKEKSQGKFSYHNRLRSFKYAFSGLKILFKTEHNSRIHFVAALIAVIAGFYFHIGRIEWLAILFSIGIVFIAEIINSSIEYLSDAVSPGFNEKIRKAKDLAAAAVLIAAFLSLITGLIIFLPKILQ